MSAAATKKSAERSKKEAARINAQTAADQEIGPLPKPKDKKRRHDCSQDLRLTAETYFPATFYKPFAPYQINMLDSFQSVILSGGRKCRAVRRGGLKSTLARVAAIWSVINGHELFPLLVGATDGKANEHRKNFFDLMQSSQALLADYPELLPLMMKRRQPKKQFRLDGRLLEVTTKDEKGCIVFPDIYDAPSCQARVAPYSIKSTDVSGLSFVDRHGVTRRPGTIFYDDVQTPQSARSVAQTSEREDAITKTFGGLAGVGQKLNCIMVCTVREAEDLSCRFMDRDKHPDWEGKAFPSVIKMPDRMDLWDKYGDLLRAGETPEDGKALAQGFYVEHREAMDAGAEVAWEHDKQDDEVSALQSLMTIKYLDPEFFECEIQQKGRKPVTADGVHLQQSDVIKRLSNIDRGETTSQSSFLTGFIDSSDEVLWWMVCAWAPNFTGYVVDYGTWPDQQKPIFYKEHLPISIAHMLPGTSWESRFVHAHNELEAELFGKYPGIDLLLKDWSDGEHKPLIEGQLRTSKHSKICRPSKGFAVKPGKKPVHLYGDKRDRHTFSEWVERRPKGELAHVQLNANVWKSHAARRLLTPVGAPSSVALFGAEERDQRVHRLLVEHLTAEKPVSSEYDGASGIVWEQNNLRDNDWWDCFVGNGVAASMLGCVLPGTSKPDRRKKRRRRRSRGELL